MGRMGINMATEEVLGTIQEPRKARAAKMAKRMADMKSQGKVTAKTPDNVKGTKADMTKSKIAAAKRRKEIADMIKKKKAKAKSK